MGAGWVSAWFAAAWRPMLSEKGESGTFLGFVPGSGCTQHPARSTVWGLGGLGGGPRISTFQKKKKN